MRQRQLGTAPIMLDKGWKERRSNTRIINILLDHKIQISYNKIIRFKYKMTQNLMIDYKIQI